MLSWDTMVGPQNSQIWCCLALLFTKVGDLVLGRTWSHPGRCPPTYLCPFFLSFLAYEKTSNPRPGSQDFPILTGSWVLFRDLLPREGLMLIRLQTELSEFFPLSKMARGASSSLWFILYQKRICLAYLPNRRTSGSLNTTQSEYFRPLFPYRLASHGPRYKHLRWAPGSMG